MSDYEGLAQQFETHRNHLQAVAYRMLGSLSEAEDAVQESWLRLSRSDTSSVENLGGWLTTVVSRVCLDMLRSRKTRREESIETLFPDTFASHEGKGNPEHEALLADSVGLALLVVLGNLNPAERITFVLHDIFAMPFTEIAAIVGKSETATRQLASRARRRVQGVRTAPEADLASHRKLINAFLAAAHAGDFDTLVAALDPEVVLRDDRQSAASRVTRGAISLAKQVSGRVQASQPALVNGSVGVIVAPRGKLLYILKYTIKNEKITEIDLISDPERIRQLDLAILGD
ncbi:sigma-70 family RNA polymerase sigma factor [Paenibacillus radicis (ex Xue et al. 2023)]|uniref:Sigma-70 family RNA polymerase sigma factor n=1 Tax=Paenibacillus radicis (ex Xue et al. 2023) TaxID=2972489 RepID=A0ABT1YH50_9BACL|nr:sigma-70 family RNA polymerase sigma factor [Paenibacillus radicis (ex Xue et al. 2023)]MCR8631558.1 sigma-70 family RNA polymerase sigma factor [Paenibacillus radicis (ex Xue et al. 2023)]